MDNGLQFLIRVMDDAADRMVIDEAFQEISYAVEVKNFIDGQSLLKYLEEKIFSLYPSLIVPDNILPGLEAADILYNLQGISFQGHIPVLINTTLLTPSKKEQLLSLGAYACFEKENFIPEVVQLARELKDLAEANLKVS